MDIIYSVGAKVPGGGIGNVSYHALKALNERKLLKKAFIIQDTTLFLNPEFKTTFPYLDKIPNYLLKDNLFDFLVSKKLTASTIFHGWNNFSLMSMRKAKKLGAITVIERASSHILTQKQLLEEEMRKFGVKNTPVNLITLKKSIREYQLADFVFVPSNFAYQSFLDQGYPKEKLRLIQFGVDLNKYKIRKRKDDGIFRIIFVGQVGIRKGVPYLLDAWQQLGLKNAELLIIGPIFPDISHLLKRYRLNNVKMVNFSNNLEEYYEKSDIFVFPSIEEGSALVTYEAMASGLPVVTTPNSGSLVEDSKNGLLVKAGDSESLKQAIEKLYNNRDLLVKFSSEGRKKVENYSWENYEAKLIETYQEIIK